MSIEYQVPSVTIPANSSRTTWDYPFEIPFQADGMTPAVAVYTQAGSADPILVDSSLYSINGVGVETGGTVTYPLSGPPLDTGNNLIITRALLYSQPAVFLNTGFVPSAIESALDFLAMQIQQLALGTGGGGSGPVSPGVITFNTRTGNVVLSGADVTTALTYTPVNRAGDTMSGRLVAAASGTGGSGFRLTPGVAPSSPANGDLWSTAASLFVQINGATFDLLDAGGSFDETTPFALGGTTTELDLVQRFAQDYSIMDFGAACDGATDDTAAWNLMIAAANAGTVHSIRVPGLSNVAGSLNHLNVGLTISGLGTGAVSGLVQTSGSGILLNFDSLPPTARVCIRDLSFLTTQFCLGQALRIHYASSNFGMGVTIFNVECKGLPGTPRGYNQGIELVNVGTTSIQQVVMVGYGGTALGVTAPGLIDMQSAWAFYSWAETGKTSFDIKWEDCTLSQWNIMWKGSGNVQGHTWEQCAPGFGGTMWSYFASDATLVPYFCISDCQCEFFVAGALFDNVSAVTISDSQFYPNNAINNRRTALGFSNSFDITIHDCKIVGGDTNGLTDAILLNAVEIADIHDNQLRGYGGYGIRFFGNTSYAVNRNNDHIGVVIASAILYSNEGPSFAQQQSCSRRGQREIGTNIDPGDVAAGVTSGAVTNTITSWVTCAVAAQVGDLIRVQSYIDITSTFGSHQVISTRIREKNHAPSSPDPYQIMQFGLNRNNLTNPIALETTEEEQNTVEGTCQIIAYAADALYALDIWSGNPSGTATISIAQLRVTRL